MYKNREAELGLLFSDEPLWERIFKQIRESSHRSVSKDRNRGSVWEGEGEVIRIFVDFFIENHSLYHFF